MQLQKLRDRYAELQQEMSDIRKTGRDTFFAELRSLEFAPAIRMAQTTYEQSDILKIKSLISVIEREIKEAKEGNEFANVYNLIVEINDLMREGNFKEAKKSYLDLRKSYSLLPKEEQRTVYAACEDILERLTKVK